MEKYVLLPNPAGFAVTTLANHLAIVCDRRKISIFRNNPRKGEVWTKEDVYDFCEKYCGISREQFVPAP